MNESKVKRDFKELGKSLMIVALIFVAIYLFNTIYFTLAESNAAKDKRRLDESVEQHAKQQEILRKSFDIEDSGERSQHTE